jgi:hypothetical protein
MSKTVIIILCIFALLLVSGVAIARYKGLCGGTEGRIGWMANRLDKQLELNDSQRKQLDILRSEVVTIAETLRGDGSSYVTEAVELLNQPTLDRERAHTLLMQKQAQLASVSSDLIEAFADFSDNLEQHQRDKLQAMILKHRQHRHCGFACSSANATTQE